MCLADRGETPLPRMPLLLTPEAEVFGVGLEIGAKRIDVEPAAAVVARIDGEIVWGALPADVDKYSFHAGLMEVIVLAVGHEIFEE